MDKKILISIVTIDRDAYAIPQVFQSIEDYLERKNIFLLIICRESDVNCLNKWKILYPQVKIITVPHYNISKRHNLEHLCKKRNIALTYAKENNFQYLFFIDSDIIIQKNTLEILLIGCETGKADICSIPYIVKWLGYAATGVIDKGYKYIKVNVNENDEIEYKKGGGGMGCTLIKDTAFHIPFNVKRLQINRIYSAVVGEDIGFFVKAVENNLLCLYANNHKIIHL